MINSDVFFGSTPTELVPFNRIELNARLGKNIDLNSDIVNLHIKKYNQEASYRYSYTIVPYKKSEYLCSFEDELIESSSLSKSLDGSTQVILLAVTAGISVDKLISKTAMQSSSAAFYIDAIASAGIESYIEYISKHICDGLNVTNRFSPGYADFPLKFQSYLLERLSAKETLGILLSKDYFMIPTKSITAVIGIK